MTKLTLITTGGTIDGADIDTDALREGSDAEKWLHEQEGVECAVINVMNKDSRLVDDHDREGILNAVQESQFDAVLVTHGTYTIAETGRYLKKHLDSDKLVLLTGAWTPFNEKDSDASNQMKFALETVIEGKQKGVFIAMDGRLWDPDQTEKVEINPGRFELVSETVGS